MSEEIVLYQYGGMGALPSLSPPCLKVGLALRLLGVPHRVVDLGSPRAVRRHSPSGRVPAIEYRGERLAESVAIMDRLQELFPAAALWQGDRATEGRLWDCFVTDTLYWLGFAQRWLVPATRDRLLGAFLGEGFSFRKLGMRVYAGTVLRRRAHAQGVGLRPLGEVREAYLRGLDMIVAGLEGGSFLSRGTAPGRADVAAVGHLAQLTFARNLPPVGKLLAGRPELERLVGAVFERARLDAP